MLFIVVGAAIRLLLPCFVVRHAVCSFHRLRFGSSLRFGPPSSSSFIAGVVVRVCPPCFVFRLALCSTDRLRFGSNFSLHCHRYSFSLIALLLSSSSLHAFGFPVVFFGSGCYSPLLLALTKVQIWFCLLLMFDLFFLTHHHLFSCCFLQVLGAQGLLFGPTHGLFLVQSVVVRGKVIFVFATLVFFSPFPSRLSILFSKSGSSCCYISTCIRRNI